MVDRDTREAVVVGQVPPDGVRAGVQAGLGQLLAQPDDQLDRRRGQRGREVFGRRERGSKAPRRRPGSGPAAHTARNGTNADRKRGMSLVDKIAVRRRRDAGSGDAEAGLGPIEDQRNDQVFLVIKMTPQLTQQ